MPDKGKIEGAVVEALDGAMRRVEEVGDRLGSVLSLPGLARARAQPPGEPAGIEHLQEASLTPRPGEVVVERLDYGGAPAEHVAFEDFGSLLDEPRSDRHAVRWWNVKGLHPSVVEQFRHALSFHALAAEDVMHVPQRPRVEDYDDHLFVTIRLLRIREDGGLHATQIVAFLYADTLLTFQEHLDDLWSPIRARILHAGSHLGTRGPDFLLYALLDAAVDHTFPLLEHHRDVLEDLEDEVLEHAGTDVLQKTQGIKRDISLLRRVLWPTRDMLDQLGRLDTELVTEATRVYLRDVHDHAIQAVDILDTLRELANGLVGLHMSAASQRANDTMKVLTLTATLFIPVTFLAGVYGMNFEYMPELAQRWAYPAFWVICSTIIGGLLLYFRRRGWFGSA
jgi:magnesium transporter